MDEEPKKINKKMLAGASGGIMAFTTAVFAYIDSKIDDVNKRVDDKYTMTKDYVDTRHTEVQNKLESIENVLIRIDNRVYELTKNQKGY